MADVTKELKVKGHVQGVGFRYAVCNHAHRLGVRGWVKNCSDGSVEALVQGDSRIIRQMIDWIKAGPGLAHVESVQIGDAQGEFHEFEIRY